MKNKEFFVRSMIRFGIVAVLLVVAFFLYKSISDNNKEKELQNKVTKTVAYEILDDSVQLDKEVDKWMNQNLKKEGFYAKKTDKETFILISGGTQKTTGYGISLNAVDQKKANMRVEYEVIAPSPADKVEKKETTPHMILRISSKDVQVKGLVASLDDKHPSKEGKQKGH